jgi:hypothetical protein
MKDSACVYAIDTLANCGTSNWHTKCEAGSNFSAAVVGGTPALTPPGDPTGHGLDQTVAIANADVVINSEAASLKGLAATGYLSIDEPLVLTGASAIENLTVGSDLTVGGELTLTGNSSRQAGALGSSGNGVFIVEGTLGIEDPIITMLSVVGLKAQADDSIPAPHVIAGKKRIVGAISHRADVTIEAGGRIENTINDSWDIFSGNILEAPGVDGVFVNEGNLNKLRISELGTLETNLRIDASLDGRNKSAVHVEEGSLTLRRGAGADSLAGLCSRSMVRRPPQKANRSCYSRA